MIATDGKRTIAHREIPIDRQRKIALRLKAIAPMAYRRAVRQGRLPQV